MHELALFAGAGGGILGGKLLGWRTVGAVEINPYCISSLAQRQNDGILAPFPIWDDVSTFRGDNLECAGFFETLRSLAHSLVVSGGFPCQDVSLAGTGDGLEGVRSGLWSEMRRIIGEIRSRYILLENSPALTFRGGMRIVNELTAMGYVLRWGVMGARNRGGFVERERIWIAGANQEYGQEGLGDFLEKVSLVSATRAKCPDIWNAAPPESFGIDHGMDSYVDQVEAVGNGQVPGVVELAWETLGWH